MIIKYKKDDDDGFTIKCPKPSDDDIVPVVNAWYCKHCPHHIYNDEFKQTVVCSHKPISGVRNV